MDRRLFITSVVGLTATVGFRPSQILAQPAGYPSKPVKVIVPFPPGGAADTTMRLLGPKLTEVLGQPVVVENKSGANGIIGAEAVAKAAADGHTLLFAPREVFGVNPTLHKSLPYDPVDGLAAIGIVVEAPYVLIANPSLGITTVKQLLDLAKTKELAFASFGVGSMGHLNLEAFAQRMGITLRHIPYKGAPDAVRAVVSGEVALAISTPPAALGLLQENKLIALAVGSEKRLDMLPHVPTLGEAGIAPDTLLPAFFAMAAPKGTPPAVIERLSSELKRALADPAVIDRLSASGLNPVGGTPQDMRQVIAHDVTRFAALVKAIGIKPE
jgi:tripartite-type tricarboxylate transporter receptor subunit TctC